MYNMISRINHKINNIRWGRLVALFVSVVMSFGAQAQSSRDSLVVDDTPRTRWMVRTNLIWWATLTPNVGVDYQVSPRWTLGATFGLNPWSLSGDKKWKHFLVAPEVRRFSQPLDRLRLPSVHPDYKSHTSYWGMNAFYSHYNVSNVTFPFGLYKEVRDHRLQGDLAALGIFYGHTWRLSRLFRLEAEVGIGGGYAWYDKYECGHCGAKVGEDKKAFLVPKLALNIVLDPGRKGHYVERIPEPVEPVVEKPVLAVAPLLVPKTVADRLMDTNPIVQEIADYRPYDRTRVLRRDSGALFVHFPLDKSDLRREFRSNAETLDRIVDITRQILADSASNVRLIQIVGFASVEGRQGYNENLAQQRAVALRQYIQEQVAVPDSLFELNNGGEAWAELRDQLAEAIETNTGDAETIKRAMVIIDEEADADRREQRLRRLDGGRVWNYLKTSLLADQRNSGYLRIFFDRVPDRQAEQINAASALIQEERYEEALAILNKVRDDSRAWNALAVSLYMTGHKDEALGYFRQAASQGNADAAANLQRLGGH